MASTAIRAAIDLFYVPSRVRLQRHAALPDDIVDVLRIASGDTDAERVAAAELGREPATVRSAASFYVEQILLHSDADSYRVLGAAPTASTAELRRNMAMLITWLHPDKMSEDQRSVFAARVTKAWDNLKTLERRTEYDKTLAARDVADVAQLALKPAGFGATPHPLSDIAAGRSMTVAPSRPARIVLKRSASVRPFFLRRFVDRLFGRSPPNHRG